MQMDVTGYGGAQTRRRATLQRTRRFALVAVVAGAVALFLATGATFTATNDTVTITPSAATSAPSVISGALSAGQRWVKSTTTAKSPPSWTPTLNTVVATSDGDIAVVDTTGAGSGTQIITVAYGNAGALNQAYSYLILPVDIYESDDAGVTDAWALVTDTSRYLTLTNGYQQYFLPGGKYYEVHVPSGGSIYTISTSAGSLSPTFIVTVTAG